MGSRRVRLSAPYPICCRNPPTPTTMSTVGPELHAGGTPSGRRLGLRAQRRPGAGPHRSHRAARDGTDMSARAGALAAVAAALLAACGETATLPVDAGTGPMPTLPPPHPSVFPTVDIATAEGWK